MSTKPVKSPSGGDEQQTVPKALVSAGVYGTRLITRSVLRRLKGGRPNPVSLKSMAKPFVRFTIKFATQPDAVITSQMRLVQNAAILGTGAAMSLISREPMRVTAPERGDGRFKDIAWTDRAFFNFIQQAYLMSDRWIMDTIDDVRGLDEHDRHKVRFFTSQVTAALSPSNFVLTNPEVLRTTVDTRGRNLVRGLANFLRDLDDADGQMFFRMSDPKAFEVGRNLADTPGDVIYQNDLMQLIQYRPTTETVHRRPLMVVPPWINKYYILDLGAKKSFIRYWVEKGHTVFVISWVNPGKEHADKGFEDYMLEGPVAALDAIEKATGEREVNAVGYCIGGTLLGCALAWLAARGDDRVKSATFFNSLLDFSDVGDIEVFIDEDMISKMEKAMKKQGYLDGVSMATAFSMLRANSLIWSFYINNYLLGRETPPFDLLHWNTDCTRLPGAMHSFYLRNMYLENRLGEPGGITLAGTPIDLSQVKVPAYFASAIEDHIALWKSCYKGSRYLGGPVRFVLGGSGHIAGIINPPYQNKYGYRINENTDLSPDEWLSGAEEFEGSWWPDWVKWAEQFSGGEVPARIPGDGELPVIEPAPGSYVRNEPAPEAPKPRKRKTTAAERTTGKPAEGKSPQRQRSRKPAKTG
ncbi:class I poly(R)-hydroxyalkanoic acid synthase [Marinobacter panjinensis]|uniref:Class I poly(R)-hydroxyalkanoic acid synthase n=1 Tax=Marinobacter panjinensis TaxID=2576384 RepID=A0A4U6QWS7_9GAMM|nr:class I poly(R)-hydroxyalkanoic acid synthase [Marinobacter panjinensis]MCR8915249.1 class I poly(R)-hydroxyalkanoic acid synthase [Marinobacter panjinensis]TKV64466.1 class I poly(R)-hydroxyalkanoic acid synthase [Marinobacter panjinensis]